MNNEIELKNIAGKNLLDYKGQIENQITRFANHNKEIVIGVAMNKYTKEYLNRLNIYGFEIMHKKIPIIIDDRLLNFEIMYHKEKMAEATEYEPYIRLENKNE